MVGGVDTGKGPGVEKGGSYSAGIVRHLALAGISVLEVTGPDKADRGARGKDDTIVAVAAAHAARQALAASRPDSVAFP